jgi:hypothetical protein
MLVGPCPRPRPGGYRCRSRRCPECGVLWAGDTRRRLLANIEAYGGDVALVTITAPGRDRLPDQRSMRRWNLAAPRRWRPLHRAARQAATRACGSPPKLVSWTWEYQRRGALHKHVVVGVDTARELAAAHAYVAALAGLRGRHDFGFVDRGRRAGGRRVLEVIPAQRAARYVAKYLSPLDAQGKPTITETVSREDVPPMVVYVSRAMTDLTGVTMRYLRHRRLAHVLGIDPDTGETIGSIIDRARGGDLTALERLVQLRGEPET